MPSEIRRYQLTDLAPRSVAKAFNDANNSRLRKSLTRVISRLQAINMETVDFDMKTPTCALPAKHHMEHFTRTSPS